MALKHGGAGSNWTQEETILAYDLLRVHRPVYPSRIDAAELAGYLGRSLGSVTRKLGNLRSAETNGSEGLPHRSRVDDEIVSRFAGRDEELRRAAVRIRETVGRVSR